MALKGTIVKLGNGLAIECSSQSMELPQTTIHTWTVRAHNFRGSMRYVEAGEEIGKSVTLGHDGLWSGSLGNGAYFNADTDKLAVKVETIPVPCPKVRGSVETRWHHNGYVGLWQKYSKREGWITV